MVLRGRSDLKLLDTYDEERLPNAKMLTQTTDRFFGLVAGPNPILAFLRIYIFPYVANLAFGLDFVKQFVFPRISQIAINYRGLSLAEQHGSFNVKAGDRMPWFEMEGASIYDRLREPVFHLVVFLDGKTDIPPIPNDLMKTWHGLIDSTVLTINTDISKIFDTKRAFFIILRPDNYIGLISDEFSPDIVHGYLSKFAKV